MDPMKSQHRYGDRARYGDVVRFTGTLSDPHDDCRFMWIGTQYEDARGGNVGIAICITGGGSWDVGRIAYKNPMIFEVVE